MKNFSTVEHQTSNYFDLEFVGFQNFNFFLSRLGLHLPHPVNPKTSSAKWDPKNSTLIVTMTMTREYDFVNF